VYPLSVPRIELDGQRSLARLEIADAIAAHYIVPVLLGELAQRLASAGLRYPHVFSVHLSQPRDADSPVAL
jgi:hypothetical protein